MRGAKEQSAEPRARPAVAVHEDGDASLIDVPVSRRDLGDLAALLALPRMWRHRDVSVIAGSLLDVLVSLVRPDVAYVRLLCGGNTFEQSRPDGVRPGENLAWTPDTSEVPGAKVVPNPLGSGSLRALTVPAHLDEHRVFVVVCSARPDFPTEVESFMCRVAVEQAMIAVHSSHLVASLTRANAAKSTFLATMSHELRTPLNAIIGYSDLLEAEISGRLNGLQKQHIGRIESAARHLMELIEGILGFARIEAGKEKVQLSDIDPSRLAEDMAALVEPLARARLLDISTSTPDRPPVIRTDPAKVRQILLNLLSNAVKFTHEGQVALQVQQEGSHVLWVVSDSGIGIGPEDLERIFEPFSQVGERHAGRAPGTGLGLSVSRQLARLLGGDVTATSEVGRGSRFTLRLPLVPDSVGDDPAAAHH